MKKWKVTAYRGLLALMPNPRRDAQCTGDVPAETPRILRRHHTVSGAVATFDGKGMTGLCLYGDVRKDTYYRVASISKHITAMAAWRLHEAGMIDVDADVDGFLPCSLRHPKATDTPITLRRLLSHTAGIHDGDSYLTACIRAMKLSEVMQGDSHTETFGGFEYSNLGAGIAACALEGMLGKSFEEIMQEAVFGPLRVNASFYPQKLQGDIAETVKKDKAEVLVKATEEGEKVTIYFMEGKAENYVLIAASEEEETNIVAVSGTFTFDDIEKMVAESQKQDKNKEEQ